MRPQLFTAEYDVQQQQRRSLEGASMRPQLFTAEYASSPRIWEFNPPLQ